MTRSKIVRFLLEQARIDSSRVESEQTNIRAGLKLVREIIGTARACESFLVPEADLSLTQFSILDRLGTAPESTLAQEVLVRVKETGTASSVSTQLTRMEANGWITRRLTPDNRRAMTISMTDKGQQRYTAAMEKFKALVEERLPAYKPEHIAALFVALKTFRRLLEGLPGLDQNTGIQNLPPVQATESPMIIFSNHP